MKKLYSIVVTIVVAGFLLGVISGIGLGRSIFRQKTPIQDNSQKIQSLNCLPIPGKIHKIGIMTIKPEYHLINLQADRKLLDSLQVFRYGKLVSEQDFYMLFVDSRYEFNSVVDYLRQF